MDVRYTDRTISLLSNDTAGTLSLDEDGAHPIIDSNSPYSIQNRDYGSQRLESPGGLLSPEPSTSESSRSRPRKASISSSVETVFPLASGLPPLQARGHSNESDNLNPVLEDDPQCFDLVTAPEEISPKKEFSLENRSEQLFSQEHLKIIFADPALLFKFTTFLTSHRPQSVPVLVYYLDSLKALRAIEYANAISEALNPIQGHEFTTEPARITVNATLEHKAKKAFEVLAQEDLPAYITSTYTRIVSLSIRERISGALPPNLREASEGLAEVFCLTDPSRPDNPIIFASDEFHRTTQYGMDYVAGRNCRFLQGPKSNPRRDGSPFMNLLMLAPLCDSRGKVRYFIGAQVDVSGLVKDCTCIDSFQRLVGQEDPNVEGYQTSYASESKEEFQELCEMFNTTELDIVRKCGGRMHKDIIDDEDSRSWRQPRLLLKEPSPDLNKLLQSDMKARGRLRGIYENYVLIRPFPSLRVLFASPSLRVPGFLQSPFMDKIGGSSRVREELLTAFAGGRGVTAKVRWVSKTDDVGRKRWIHCTPLQGHNGNVGVWMIILVDDDREENRKWRLAPPVDARIGRTPSAGKRERAEDEVTYHKIIRDENWVHRSPFGHQRSGTPLSFDASIRSGSPLSFAMS
ncbi:hypothetical protein L228DRAFT_280268 [Xylona heveae TC161]|uniref:PAS domain-containing protein n=1 Tax=Xylona heveae (strain CBS 132557 / TC161) TaxID=1328760 RepID=A0A165IJN3_XYLHT|nr:hypothetical protein L228DRAFT_280268 [Xylona heveae TC161]KZF24989.1 hypothetical protein L228DRAFT_280268 [Xylona heveae TC161]